MGLIKAKCTECGAPLQVNEGSKRAKCPHCGNIFIVEDAVNNYNYTYNTTNNIKADVLNIVNPKDEFIIQSGILIQYVGASDVVKIPDTVKKIGGYLNADKEYVGAFENSGVSEVSLPESVREIGKNAFKNCYYLKKFDAPYELDLIDEYAFFGDKKIETLELKAKEFNQMALNGLQVKELIIEAPEIMTPEEFYTYDPEDMDSYTGEEEMNVIAEKATLNVKEINVFNGGDDCELTIGECNEACGAINCKKLIVPSLEKLVNMFPICYCSELVDYTGKPLNKVVLDTNEKPSMMFPNLKNIAVFSKQKLHRCPICGSDNISKLSHKCKDCNSTITHGIKKANK